MNANRMQVSEPTVRPYVPSPWDALYNFARQVWLGCVVTFGPRAMHEPAATDDALQVRIVLIKDREATKPVFEESGT
jgi:hypothetical protein